MRHAFAIDIDAVSEYYHITDDGMVYSHIRKRWLKPQCNLCGYVFYYLSYGVPRPMWIFAHTLVALRYIGKPPTEKHEIDHLDNNRMNNYFSNLRWLTHSENILASFSRGRVHAPGRGAGFSHSFETKMKMADAKKKRVLFEGDGSRIVFESIDDATVGLSTYRKKIYLCIKDGKEFGGGRLSFVPDKME